MDGSKDTRTALSSIGLDYDTLAKGFADGSLNQVQAMHMVIGALNEVEDPIARKVAGVGLFGTQFEDATEKGVLGLENTEEALVNTEGAAKSLNDQYDTTASELEAATRLWDDALVDVGDELNDLATYTLPFLAEAMTNFIVPAIDQLAEFFRLLGEGKGISWDWGEGIGTLPMPWETQTPELPVTVPQSQGSASIVGSETHVNVYVERGDPDTVMQATQLGVSQAQRMRGE